MVHTRMATATVLVCALATWCFGCAALGPPCDTSDDGNPAEEYKGGTTVDGVYMSGEWTGPLLPFPGGKRYELVHELGCPPREIDLWASFSNQGVSSGSMAPCAGNMCLIQAADSRVVRVKNDTCQDLFLLVTASTPACQPGADASEAGEGGP